MDANDAQPVESPVACSSDASTDVSSRATVGDEPDDRAGRRAALRDLSAMIGVEVFY